MLFGSTASLCADRNYQETIQDKDNYYPSPALFVYTLPNIVTGEIAIRNNYWGETAFYVLDKEQDLDPIVQATLENSALNSAIAGWCECQDKDNFYAKLQIIWNN